MRFGLGDATPTFTATGSTTENITGQVSAIDPSGFAAAQAANPGDPALQQVVYNPITGVYGPAPLGYGQQGLVPAVASTSFSMPLLLGFAVLLALVVGKR